MKNLFFKPLAVAVLLFCSSIAFAAFPLKSISLQTLPNSEALSYQLADKITKGPIPAGSSQQLNFNELQALAGASGGIVIIPPNGQKTDCLPFPITFEGNMTIKALWQPGHFKCDVKVTSNAGAPKVYHNTVR